MTIPEDRKQELREQELRRRELNSSPLPLYESKNKKYSENSLKGFGGKFVKFIKFAGLAVIGIALIRVGFWLGMWITYLSLTAIITFIGYQIFLNTNN